MEVFLKVRSYAQILCAVINKSVIGVGDNVILKNDKSLRVFSKLARVEELMKSRDNVVRSVRICVPNTENGKLTYLRHPFFVETFGIWWQVYVDQCQFFGDSTKNHDQPTTSKSIK